MHDDHWTPWYDDHSGSAWYDDIYDSHGYYDDHLAPWYDDHSGSGGYYDDHSGSWYDDSGSAWYDDSGSGWYDDASGPTYDDDWYVTATQGRAMQQEINDGVYYDDAYYWDDYTSGDDWYAAKGPNDGVYYVTPTIGMITRAETIGTPKGPAGTRSL